jgi:hypothetical protein
MQAHAGHQDGRDRNQRERTAAGRRLEVQHGAFVLAEQAGDALQGDRVHIEGVPGQVADRAPASLAGGVEAVVHAGGQPQGHVAAALVALDELLGTQQIEQRVGHALGLQHQALLNPPHGAHDRVAGAGQHVRAWIHRPRPGLQPPREDLVQRPELRPLGFREVQIWRKLPPNSQTRAQPIRILDPTQPPHQPRRQHPRDAVRAQEVERLPLRKGVQPAAPSGRASRQRPRNSQTRCIRRAAVRHHPQRL